MNRECVAAIPKPRKRRAESNVGLDTPAGIPISGILGGNATAGAHANAVATQPAPARPVAIDRSESQDSLLSRPDIRHNGSKSCTALLARGLKLDSPYLVRRSSCLCVHL